MAIAPPIDFAEVARRADLRGIIERDLGPPTMLARKPHWPCPFHADKSPSLYLFDGGRRWRCWPCTLAGDALDYLTRREGIGPVEAAILIDPSLAPGQGREARRQERPPRPAEAPRPAAEPTWRGPHWQAAVAELVERARAALWSRAGRPALDWLRARGLAEDAIGMHRLGYLPAEGKSTGLWHERGILIPWPAPIEGDGSRPLWVGANVRRLMPDPGEKWAGPDKCKAIGGSERGHLYPFAEILPTQGLRPALVVEGEIDALIAQQEAGHLLHVGTVGGSAQTPRPSARVALARCPWWLLAFDHDSAGVEAASRWLALAPHKARRVMLPHGKDLGEFHQAGGDVREWIAGELARLGILPIFPDSVATAPACAV